MQLVCNANAVTLRKNSYLYGAMKIYNKILTLFVSVLVMMTTTLQFHHHDCHGVAFFSLLQNNEVTLDASSGLLSLEKCHHKSESCSHHAPDCKGHGKCSLHIDQSDIFRSTAHLSLFPIETQTYDIEDSIAFPLTTFYSTVLNARYYLRHLSLIIKTSSIFRAPPFMCI